MGGRRYFSEYAWWVRLLARELFFVDPLFQEVALNRDVEGDLFLQDIGQGFGFRPGSFDGAIRYDHLKKYYIVTKA